MSIQNFYNVAARHDFARLFQFRVDFLGNVPFGEKHLTYVETATLPGRSINNVVVPYMGMNFNVPGTISYPGSTNYTLTFRCDEDYDIRSSLEAMMFDTFDEAFSAGNYRLPGEESKLVMTLLNKDFEPVRAYTLFGVYVQAIQDTQYDIKDTGTIATVQATLAYQFWRAGTPETGGMPVLNPTFDIPNQGGSVNSWR
jgi:hypothetical protein